MANKGFSINTELSNKCSDGTMVTINEYLTYLDVEAKSEDGEFKFEDKYIIEFAQSSLQTPNFAIGDITQYQTSNTLLLTFLVEEANYSIEVGQDQTFLIFEGEGTESNNFIPANELTIGQFVYGADGFAVGCLLSAEAVDVSNATPMVAVTVRDSGLSIHKDIDGIKLSNNIVLGF
jgi:hypothetical protein|tara:strand:+ start:905 stop:1435 length:531 start_codon:yes stop_codon:yes gene_type:complete